MFLSTRRPLLISFLERIKKKGGMGGYRQQQDVSQSSRGLAHCADPWLREVTR